MLTQRKVVCIPGPPLVKQQRLGRAHEDVLHRFMQPVAQGLVLQLRPQISLPGQMLPHPRQLLGSLSVLTH
jgi:hypothetical protein